MTFSEYVNGKSVAIVAPGAYLMGSKQRELIESHDLVARINRGFPVPPAMIEDIGERCDILYHLLAVGMAANEKDFSPCVGKVGFIISTHHQGEPRIARFKQVNRGRVPFECVPFSMLQKVKLKVRKAPNAGVVAVSHLLSQPIRSLYLTGFSFYQDGYYAGYGGHPKGAFKGGQPGHDQNSAKACMKQLLASATVPITTDATMAQILERSLEIKRQLAEIAPKKPSETVELRALMAMRFGQDTLMTGETFLRVRKEADILIRKGRAVLV